MKHTSKSEKETRKLAAKFAKDLKGGEVVELVGDLGSGKTTFVRGVAEALGAKARVKSPTFTIMNEYPARHKSIKRIIHIDLYRFKDPAELRALELEDYFDGETVVFIEWPDVFHEQVINGTHAIRFTLAPSSSPITGGESLDSPPAMEGGGEATDMSTVRFIEI